MEFPALKWAITEQFQEYLLWKPYVVKTDNSLLTYIMTTPNLDTTWHHWVESLTGFTFIIEYQKGRGNAADAHDPVVAETDEEIPRQVQEAAI